ncbi:MAG: hypothetical protein KGL46_11165, partial [Hyphomicrobiales bacterium]|nr:hypothetical protein [Hyphomicrobiales bacterium]
MRKPIAFLFVLLVFPRVALADMLQKTCHCDLAGNSQALYNLTSTVGWYPQIWVVSPADQNDCRNKCDNAFAGKKQQIASTLCSYPPTMTPDNL